MGSFRLLPKFLQRAKDISAGQMTNSFTKARVKNHLLRRSINWQGRHFLNNDLYLS